MKEIPLTKGMFALVDDEDYERLNRYRWHVISNVPRNENRRIYYARRWRKTDKKRKDGTTIFKPVYMHRMILGLRHGTRKHVPNHIDYNGLNNCRSNLEILTFSENLCKKRPAQKLAKPHFQTVSSLALNQAINNLPKKNTEQEVIANDLNMYTIVRSALNVYYLNPTQKLEIPTPCN